MIIDAHVHVHPEPDGYGASCDATLDNLMRNLDACDVEKAILFPIAADTPYVKRTSNEFIHDCCRKHPDRLLGYASINPLESADPARDLEKAVREFDLHGLKLHPRFMGFCISDEFVLPLVHKAGELGIPVAVDCYLWRPTPLHTQLPMHFDTVCKAAPETNIIMCHTGGFRFLDALAVAKANDNVYFDTSLSLQYFRGTPFEDQFLFVLKSIGAERLIYGSDHPQRPIAQCRSESRDILLSHGFTDDMLNRVFGGTIRSLVPALQ